MMCQFVKKILIVLFICMTSFSFCLSSSYAQCSMNLENDDIGAQLTNCLDETDLVGGGSSKIGDGFAASINTWTRSLAVFLFAFAVGSIVYGGLLMTLSGGEEEKINKAKEVVKWGIIGFLGVISASAIILLIINVMFAI